MNVPAQGFRCAAAVVLFVWCAASAPAAQSSSAPKGASPATARNSSPAIPSSTATPPFVPADYVVGADDVLTVYFWREKDVSGDFVVRPDGRISLPLINDVDAAGLTVEQLRVRLTEAGNKVLQEPTVTVIVKEIHSRKVFITGQINKPGAYPLGAPITVMQLITMAGGVQEYADGENIQIIRVENGRQVSQKFNYNEVKKGKNLQQNILLKPGDTIVVP